MRRSSSITVAKDNPRLTTSFLANKSHSQDTDSFCYDKLESVHFESQQIHTKLEALIIKMRNDVNIQNTFKTDHGFIKLKKDDFVYYYNQLRDTYKSLKKLSGNWDAIFDDFSTMHSNSVAKRNKEVESLSNHYKYKLKALEFEKKSALEAQKNDLLRREQEVLDSVNSFINTLKGTKKFWDNNLNELQFCVREQAQSLEYLSKHKAAKLKVFGEEIDAIFNEMGTRKGFGTPSSSDNAMSSERIREYADTSKQPLNQLINNLSPINQGLLNKTKGDLSTKRERDHGIDNTYEDIFMLNGEGNREGMMPENSRSSGDREEGGWDPNLDEEESMESIEVDKIEKALELLFQNGLLDQHAVGMFEQIMQGTKDSGVDREIQLNLFKEMVKLQIRKNKKAEKNQDFPLKMLTKLNPEGIVNTTNSPPESSLGRKALGTRSQHLENTGSQQYQIVLNKNGEEQMGTRKSMKGSTTQGQKYSNKENDGNVIRSNKPENKRKKNDISLSDLLKVKDYSFDLESPLSFHASREEHYTGVPQFQHVEKEDLLKADSLPVTLKEGEISKMLPEKKRLDTLEEETNHQASNNTRRKDHMDQSQIKIIEEFKNSLGNTLGTDQRPREESYDSSEKSSPYLSSCKRKLLQEDETQLEWEANNESKGESSRGGKTPLNLSVQRPMHGSTTAILKGRLVDSNSPDPYQNLIRENSLPRPQGSQDTKNPVFTMNTGDIKLSSIDVSPKLVTQNSSIKGNPVKRNENKNILRSSPLTNQTRISTKANTGYNEGEIESTDNRQLTLYSSMNHTEPMIRLIGNPDFSNIVETEGGGDEKGSNNLLNNSFPPYYQGKENNKKDVLTKFTKIPENYTSLKAVTTSGSKWGSKNLIQNGSGNVNGINSFKGSRGFGNPRLKPEMNSWVKQANVIPESEELAFQKVARKLH